MGGCGFYVGHFKFKIIRSIKRYRNRINMLIAKHFHDWLEQSTKFNPSPSHDADFRRMCWLHISVDNKRIKGNPTLRVRAMPRWDVKPTRQIVRTTLRREKVEFIVLI
jgi:hypothetical protein